MEMKIGKAKHVEIELDSHNPDSEGVVLVLRDRNRGTVHEIEIGVSYLDDDQYPELVVQLERELAVNCWADQGNVAKPLGDDGETDHVRLASQIVVPLTDGD